MTPTQYASIVGLAVQLRDHAIRGLERPNASENIHRGIQVIMLALLQHLEDEIND